MSAFVPIPYKDYRKCALTEGSESWYISYYVIHPDTGRLKRVKIKITHIKGLRERRRAAREMMSAIDQRLALGWNPFTESRSPRAFDGLFDAYDAFLRIKKKEMEESSARTYVSLVGSFKEWLRTQRIDENSYVASFTVAMATKYMTKIEAEMSPKSFNNHLAFFKGLYRWMQSKGYVAENPFANIQPKPKKMLKKNRRLLNDEELSSVMTFCAEHNRQYLAMVMLCYCCFIRPKEIALLRCRDIDLQRQTVHVAAEIAKNDNESYRTIPSEALSVLGELDLSQPDYYLFGDHPLYDFSPSKNMVCSRKIAKYWENHIRPACGFDKSLKFYSLKDTGITNMLGAGVPINVVQQQADHSSVAMTAIYVGRQAGANDRIKSADILSKCAITPVK